MNAALVSETLALCAACGVQIAIADAQNVGLYIANGAMYPHLLCDRCMARAIASKEGQAEIAELVELRFAPAGGIA